MAIRFIMTSEKAAPQRCTVGRKAEQRAAAMCHERRAMGEDHGEWSSGRRFIGSSAPRSGSGRHQVQDVVVERQAHRPHQQDHAHELAGDHCTFADRTADHFDKVIQR